MPFETLTPPPWAAVVGTDPGGWTEAEQPPFAEQRPLAGSEWVISVVSARRAVEDNVFWALFSPALSALNGPDEHPDELDAMAMVACAPLAILAQDGKHTQLRVRVQDVVGVEDAPRRFSPSTGGSFDYLPGAGGLTVLTASPTSDLLYYSYNFEGDSEAGPCARTRERAELSSCTESGFSAWSMSRWEIDRSPPRKSRCSTNGTGDHHAEWQ